MAIFSRRVVQQLIDKASLILSSPTLQWHLKRLNTKSNADDKITEVISSEWELAVMIALSELGHIKHEYSQGITKPDIFFTSQDGDLQFMADVRVVSDLNQGKENPAEYFAQEVKRLAKKYHVPINRLSYNIEGEKIVSEGRKLRTRNDFEHSIGPKLRPITQDSKMKLRLPPKGGICSFVNQNIVPFLKEISQNPNRPNKLVINNKEAHIRLKYEPRQKFFYGSHPSCKVTHSPDRNPVYRALENKSQQLRKSKFSGIKGVFLCDGGCQLLKDGGYAGLSYSIDEVIWYFWERDRTIDFIVIISVEEAYRSLSVQSRVSGRVSAQLGGCALALKPQLGPLLEKLCKYLPPIQRTPANARSLLLSKNPNIYPSFWGGFTVSENSIKLSSRSLQMLLAGEIDFEQFEREHHGFGSALQQNIFKNMLHNGRTIKSMHIEPCPNEDDDWVTIEFNSQDPAISVYKIQKKSSQKT